MQREILRPQYDQPLTVKLDFGAEGVERRSQKSGELEYMYTVNDDKSIIYLSRQGRDALLRTGAQAGDWIQVVKLKRGANPYFDVQVVSDAAEEPPPAAPPQRQIRVVAPTPNNGHEHANGVVKAAPAATVWPMEDISIELFKSAARVVKHAESYCQSIGLPVEANFEDVRALAISYLIERSRNGGGR